MSQPQPQPSQPTSQQPQRRRPYLPDLKLTRRELEVVQSIAMQMSDRQIAERLNLNVGTVKNHIFFAKTKLDVEGRVGLALWYVRSFGFPANSP